MVEARKQRGMEIAAICKIVRKRDGSWVVPSQSGNGRYTVRLGAGACECHCDCLDHENRGERCKHMFAVEFAMQREEHADGSTTVTRSVKITATKRTTYPQNWPAYNEAQTNEKRQFQTLLHSLCENIENPAHGKGRPPIALADAVFAVTFKVYSTFSGRRFMCDLSDAKDKGFIDRLPHFNSIFNYLENPDLTPILLSLITASSLPLKSVECDFAVDSTGFMTSRFNRWYDKKYGVVRSDHDWVKAHLMCGVKTNVVTAVEIHERDTGDTQLLPALVDATAENFTLREVSADKAYPSVANFEAIERHNASAFIPFTSRHTGAAGGLFAKAFHYFNFNRDEFWAHYHKRSNIESTVNMIKAKFRDHVRSKTDVAMKNEVLCKVLCHNICCLISAIYELNIQPIFDTFASCTKTLASAQKIDHN